MEQHYPFSLPPLPYPYDALRPQIDERTLHFHHDKHFATYVENLNKLLADQPEYQSWTLEQLCQNWCQLPEEIRQSVRNNAGGVYNHDLYFRDLSPAPVPPPSGALSDAIIRDIGDLLALKAALKTAALPTSHSLMRLREANADCAAAAAAQCAASDFAALVRKTPEAMGSALTRKAVFL